MEYTLHNLDCRDLHISNRDEICIVSDPPFNIGYHYNEYSDDMDETSYIDMLSSIFRGGASVIIHYPEALYKIAFNMQCIPQRVVSWVYNSNTKRQHRDIAYFNVMPNFSQVKQPYKNLNDKRIQHRMEQGNLGADLYDWFYVNQVKNINKEKTAHPCQMPLDVMLNVIGILPSQYTIYDPFMGSGTTGLACAILDRNFIGCELNDVYYNIAKDRIESYLKDKSLYIKNTNTYTSNKKLF
jgi:hypothetical protein